MKIFLILILLFIFILLGVIVYLYYINRYKVFSDLVYICKFYKNNVTFNKNEINIILNECIGNLTPISRYILKNYNSQIKMFFSNKDKSLISKFFSSLGKGDVSFEVGNAEYYENVFENEKILSKEDVEKKGLLYFKLLIAVGIIISIILL